MLLQMCNGRSKYAPESAATANSGSPLSSKAELMIRIDFHFALGGFA
jgi:hypothetical protein